jgi:hypothetical protein
MWDLAAYKTGDFYTQATSPAKQESTVCVAVDALDYLHDRVYEHSSEAVKIFFARSNHAVTNRFGESR